MDGPAGHMAGTGREQPAFRSSKEVTEISCDAKCDAISSNRIELLTRAVIPILAACSVAITSVAMKSV